MATADFTIADVLAWARKKPAHAEYKYTSNENCVIAQFLRETGRAADPRVTPFGWRDGLGGASHKYDRDISHAANAGPDTFGSFTDNLRAARRADRVPA